MKFKHDYDKCFFIVIVNLGGDKVFRV